MKEFEVMDKPFDWMDLNGKTLSVVVEKTEEGHFVCGIDIGNPENVYVLHWDIPKIKAPDGLPSNQGAQEFVQPKIITAIDECQ